MCIRDRPYPVYFDYPDNVRLFVKMVAYSSLEIIKEYNLARRGNFVKRILESSYYLFCMTCTGSVRVFIRLSPTLVRPLSNK